MWRSRAPTFFLCRQSLSSFRCLAVLAAVCFAPTAWSDCGCFCVNGERRTLCSGIDEARNHPDLCPPQEPAGCPLDRDAGAGSLYEPPESDAVNCRDVRVFDGTRGEYVSARACDIM